MGASAYAGRGTPVPAATVPARPPPLWDPAMKAMPSQPPSFQTRGIQKTGDEKGLFAPNAGGLYGHIVAEPR